MIIPPNQLMQVKVISAWRLKKILCYKLGCGVQCGITWKTYQGEKMPLICTMGNVGSLFLEPLYYEKSENQSWTPLLPF